MRDAKGDLVIIGVRRNEPFLLSVSLIFIGALDKL